MKEKKSADNPFHPLRVLPLLSFLFLAGCAISPKPFTAAELQEKARTDLQEIFDDQEPLAKEITLYDAMARAIKYNLNHKVKLLENAVAKGALVQSQKDLLPQLVTSAGYTTRNNHNASYSKNLATGITTGYTDLSISEEKQNFTSDIIFVWNILDFGVGYTQAKQQADNVLIAEEQRRKAAQNIAQELRYAFWRAVSADKLLPKMDKLVARAESALVKSRQMEKVYADKPVKILDYQQELLETVQELWSMRRNLALAKTELATLMNLRPGSDFKLKVPRDGKLTYPEFSLELLEKYALLQRPELRTEGYQERIGALEVKKAMLRILPGLELSTGASFDNNKYLYNNDWIHAGLNLSWNAFSLLSAPTAIKNAKMQKDLAKQRHLAASMMVLSQVNLAKQQYHLSLREYQITNQLDEVHRRKLWHSEAARKAQTGTELEEIRSRVDALSAEMQLGLAFSELQSSLGNIYNSIGYDPMPDKISSRQIDQLANIMNSHDKKVLDYFSARSGKKYQIQNPFSVRPVMDKNRSFVKTPTVTPPMSSESDLPIAQEGGYMADLDSSSPQTGTKVYKRATKLAGNNEQPMSTSAEQPEDDSFKVKLKQPRLYQATLGEGSGGVVFPASETVKMMLADMQKGKSKQLEALAKHLSGTKSSYDNVVTIGGKQYELATTPEGAAIQQKSTFSSGYGEPLQNQSNPYE